MYRKLICLFSFVLVLGLLGSASAEIAGHWRFDGNLDDSIGGLQGTFSDGSPTYVKGRIGQGIEFDGVSQFVNLPSENPSAYTITLWVRPARTDAASVIVRTSSSGQTTHWSHQLRINPEGVFQHYLWVGSERNVIGTTLVEADEWYHVAIAAASDGTMHLYVNGDEDAPSIDVAGTLWGDGDRYYVGSNSGHGMGWFQGIVDDVQIYDNILTAEEIARIAAASGGFPLAFKPTPKDGTLLEDTWVSLSWGAGDYAVSHDVYIGDNFDAVDSGAEDTFIGNQADTFIVAGFPGFPFPDGLVPGTTYYWRIDEVNDAEPNSPWK
ncbi:MAG: LamG domain-containing protein, partial [Sedimentisphaerales bacterium]|nr:LamG domain-containing protein [Sedimentisphaerales bacterium]